MGVTITTSGILCPFLWREESTTTAFVPSPLFATRSNSQEVSFLTTLILCIPMKLNGGIFLSRLPFSSWSSGTRCLGWSLGYRRILLNQGKKHVQRGFRTHQGWWSMIHHLLGLPWSFPQKIVCSYIFIHLWGGKLFSGQIHDTDLCLRLFIKGILCWIWLARMPRQ